MNGRPITPLDLHDLPGTPTVGAAVVIVAEVNQPRPTTHLTVLYIGLHGSAGRIDTNRYDFAAVGTAHLNLRVPDLNVGGLKQRVRIFRV
jgi:hypothetical protein